jgi:hypothetical protein
MPQNRIKASAWTPILRWLFWSPRRLALLLIAALALAWLLTSGAQHQHNTAASASATGAPTATIDSAQASTTADVPPTPSSSTTGPPPARPHPAPPSTSPLQQLQNQATQTVTRWVNLWARPTVAPKKWLAELEPLTFRDYLLQLRSIDPANTPSLHVSGPVRWLNFTAGGGIAHIPVQGASPSWSIAGLTVLRWHGAWKCSSITKVS